MDDEEVLPCPWGGKPMVFNFEAGDWQLICWGEKCGKDCPFLIMHTRFYKTKEELLRVWNRRDGKEVDRGTVQA